MALKKSVLVKLGLDDKEYTARLKAATTKLNTATNKMMRDGRRLSIASRELFVGLTLPLGILGKNVLDVTSEMEKLRKGLTLIAQSRGISAIDELVRKTEELAKLPGLGLEETFRGVQQLLSVGFGQNSALSIVEGLGIGIARAGGAAEEFDRVMRQVTQGIAKGKLEMQDFKTIFEQMPEARRILEDAFGPGMADLEKLRKRGISVQEVIVAISDGFKDLGAGDLMSSLRNQLENLSDSWKKLGSAIGSDIFGSSFNNGIGKLSGIMDNLTASIRSMSPQTKQFIANFTVMIAKVSVFLPLAAFMASRIKIMGALLLKYSTIARGAALATGLLGTSVKSLGIARMLVSLRSMGAVGAAATTAILGAGRAVSFLGKALKVAVPVLGELYIAYELLKGIFPNINKELKWMAQTIAGLAVTHFPALASAINTVSGWFKKSSDGSERMAAMARRAAGAGLDFAKNWKAPKDVLDDFNPIIEEATVNLQKLSEIKLDRLGKQLGALSLGSGFTQTSPGAKIDPFAGLDTSLSSLPNTLSNVDEFLAPFKTIKQYMEVDFVPQIWMATQAFEYLSQGIQQLTPNAQAFASVLGQGFSGFADAMAQIPNGLKAVGKAFGEAIKDMIIQLLALIAKLAIAAFLVNLIFPGGGGLGAFIGKGGSFAAGGANYGKGGFLKGILGGLGIPGLAEGGIVTKPTLVMAGEGGESEAIIPLSKLGDVGSNQNINVNLRGYFKIQGRDLVYVLEENQAMINSVRGGG